MTKAYLEKLRNSFYTYVDELWEKDVSAGREPIDYQHNGPYGDPLVGRVTPRFVSVRANMGPEGNRRLKAHLLDAAAHVIPWDTGSQRPEVYIDRLWVCLVAPLPESAQTKKVLLSALTGTAHGGVVFLGPNEDGVVVSIALRDAAHVLIGGETGSGKTSTMRLFVYQLARTDARFVLLDGKGGRGLGILDGVPGQVGPMATTAADMRNALGWAVAEMERRNAHIIEKRDGRAWRDGERGQPHPLYIIYDEFQEQRSDAVIMRLLQKLVAQGREADVHVIAGTQRPTVNMFGSDEGGTTREQFTVRIAHAVQSYKASEAVVGGNEPRADFLAPAGDTHLVGDVGGRQIRERLQMAFVEEDDLAAIAGGEPEMDAWPVYLPGDDEASGPGRPQMAFTLAQLACSICAARDGRGRPYLRELLSKMDEEISGTEPLRRLLEDGRELDALMGKVEELTD